MKGKFFSLFIVLLMIKACAASSIFYLKGTNPTVGVVLLHGRGGGGPDQNVAGTLRYALRNQLGISTIAPMLPYLPSTSGRRYTEPAGGDEVIATVPETLKAITDSIEKLKQAGINRVYLIGHSRGTFAIARYIEAGPDPTVVGLVLIGGANYWRLPDTKLPILDVYGTAEPRRVLVGVHIRKEQFSGQPNYKQVSIEGADHLMLGYEEKLISVVASWIGNLERRKLGESS